MELGPTLDGIGYHHDKWNKLHSKRKILYVISHMQNLDKKDMKAEGGLLEGQGGDPRM
jgi:hypothetical protein